ncbi:MAG: hypothetical protein ACSLFH_01705 [Desulfuromonadales bacterium]
MDQELTADISNEVLEADIGEIERFGYLPISEEMTVYYGTGPQPPGRISYRTIIPTSGVKVVIDFEDNQGLIIDAHALDGGWLPIDVVNWPEGLLGIVYLLIKMPPNGLTITWPEAACMPLPYPYSYDKNCEFELRSWNAGQTITARLVSWYPFQD